MPVVPRRFALPRAFVLALALPLVAAGSARGQQRQQGTDPSIVGTAYDSLRAEPIRGGLVSIVGSARSTTTDGEGRFRLDAVPAGEHTIALQHDGLDSIGVYGLTSRVSVRDAQVEVRLTVPSFTTLWRRVCGGEHVPADTGFVYGTVRSLVTNAPVTGAVVDLSWLDLRVDQNTEVIQERRRGQVTTDSTGGYAICGVPRGTGVVILAATDSLASGVINLPFSDLPIVRRDLLVARTIDGSAIDRGTVSGTLRTTEGAPLSGARVIVDGVPETTADSDGRYVLRDVPAGTRQLEVMSIGMMPVTMVLDVLPGTTTRFDAQLRKITNLDIVRVTASARTRRTVNDFEDRRRHGFATVKDSLEIAKYPGLLSAVQASGLIRVEYRSGRPVAILVPHPRTGECEPPVLLDGLKTAAEVLNLMRGTEIAAIEVFRRGSAIPTEYVANLSAYECGLVLIWSKRAFGGR